MKTPELVPSARDATERRWAALCGLRLEGSLERDVVFGAAPAAGGGAFEVAHVRGDVALRRREAATAATVAVATAAGTVAGAEELDAVGDDLDTLPFVA